MPNTLRPIVFEAPHIRVRVKAGAVIKAMAKVMQEIEQSAAGCCTENDLIAAGFHPKLISDYHQTAAALASAGKVL